MANLAGVVQELRKERDRAAKELGQLEEALAALSNRAGRIGNYGRRRRKLSPEAIANIRRAQKLRWSKFKAAKKG
jgi:hypothetical protein